MSRLVEFRELERRLAEDLARLEEMKNDELIKADMVFEDKMRELMRKHDKTEQDVVMIIAPDLLRSPAAAAGEVMAGGKVRQRKERVTKIYVHPDTGERIETKGGNHKTLKEWKAEFGNEMVESWLV